MVSTQVQGHLFFSHCGTGEWWCFTNCGCVNPPFYLKWDLDPMAGTLESASDHSWSLGVIFVSHQGLWHFFPIGGLL